MTQFPNFFVSQTKRQRGVLSVSKSRVSRFTRQHDTIAFIVPKSAVFFSWHPLNVVFVVVVDEEVP